MRNAIAIPVTLVLLSWFPAQDSDLGRRIYAQCAPSVVQLYVQSEDGQIVGQGSGFFVANNRIVTNAHVTIAGKVFLDLGPVRVPTQIEKTSATEDLAILRVDGEVAVKPLLLAETSVVPGETVFAIGNPQGLEKSISQGVVSGLRDFDGRKLIQITAPISQGSSGGPILNSSGQVVGVAVAMLQNGQNLNFAVPASAVTRLLKTDSDSSPGIWATLVSEIDATVEQRGSQEYSEEADSSYQKLTNHIRNLLKKAADISQNDSDQLLAIVEKAQGIVEWDIAYNSALRAVEIKPSLKTQLTLAKAARNAGLYLEGENKKAVLIKGEQAARKALGLAKPPSAEAYFTLADVLEDMETYPEAERYFQLALNTSQKTNESDIEQASLRGLIRCADALDKTKEAIRLFESLRHKFKINTWDWSPHAIRLEADGNFRAAGDAHRQAAELLSAPRSRFRYWCKAGADYSMALERDLELYFDRKCIEDGAGVKGSDSYLAGAHRRIALTLNERGVYVEAAAHAKEAITIDPNDGWAYRSLADSLVRLRRFQEAINAAKQAVQLTDGKFSTMHFVLAEAYFGTENWEFARQSFEKAAELMPSDDAAAYNVALCFVQLGYFRDAAKWFDEVLRRNPNHKDKQEILDRIRILRDK